MLRLRPTSLAAAAHTETVGTVIRPSERKKWFTVRCSRMQVNCSWRAFDSTEPNTECKAYHRATRHPTDVAAQQQNDTMTPAVAAASLQSFGCDLQFAHSLIKTPRMSGWYFRPCSGVSQILVSVVVMIIPLRTFAARAKPCARVCGAIKMCMPDALSHFRLWPKMGSTHTHTLSHTAVRDDIRNAAPKISSYSDGDDGAYASGRTDAYYNMHTRGYIHMCAFASVVLSKHMFYRSAQSAAAHARMHRTLLFDIEMRVRARVFGVRRMHIRPIRARDCVA